ncbi:MAG: cache domain-containing protein [Campylobacteraceae bacterium]|nr:cache domain-containing protein [Campylobacteraceae bacterium]
MNIFAQASLRNWIRLLPLIAVIITAIIFTSYFTYQTKTHHSKELKELKALILNNAKMLAKDRVYIVIEMIKSIQKKNLDKSLEIQKQEIQNFLQNFRFSNNNYVRVLDTKGKVITHILPSYIGKVLWDEQVNGIFYIQEFVQAGLQKNGSFLTYKNSKDLIEKVSLVTKLEGLDWVIGVDVYLADINSIFKENILFLDKDINDFIFNNVFITLIITLVCIIFIYLPSNNISEVMERYKGLLLRKNKLLENKIKVKAEEQETLLSLFDYADAVLFKWKYDVDNLTYISKSIVNITGYQEEDFLNKKIKYLECIHKNDFDEYRRQYIEAIQSNKHYYESKPYRIITKDKQVKWIHDYKLFVRNKEGLITNFVGYITDITLVKEYDLAVANQSKMASLGEMIGNISHQWRQPLAAITAAASGMKIHKEYNILDEEMFNHAIDGIMRNSKYLSETINYFSNYATHNKKLELFGINEVIDNNLHLIEANIKMNHIEVINNTQSELQTYGNTHELLQVTMNVINNAIDVLKDKDYKRLIFIETNLIENYLQIVIRDNAGGIPNEILSKIFEPYFTTKHKSFGTGLGLYMSHNIIKNMRGNILVQNVEYTYHDTEYKGAQFTINLPVSA